MKVLFFVLMSNVVQTQMSACGLVLLMIYQINIVTFKKRTKQKDFSVISQELFFGRLLVSEMIELF